MIFYATPWLLRLMAGLAALLVLRHRGIRVLAAACLVISMAEGWRSFRLDRLPESAPGALRVSVWNTGRDLPRMPSAWSGASEADVSAVIETGTFSPDRWRAFVAGSPDHQWQRLDGSTMIGVRGKIVSCDSLGTHDLFRCHRIRVDLPGRGEFTVVVADVRSQPWISREQAITSIVRAAGDDPRAIILGDFNTPPESTWYRGWRDRGFSLANDGPRRGFRETWAYGLPLWTLDQIWLGPGLKVARTDRARPGSDHARVLCTLAP